MPLPVTEPTIDLEDAHVTSSPNSAIPSHATLLGPGMEEEEAQRPYKNEMGTQKRGLGFRNLVAGG